MNNQECCFSFSLWSVVLGRHAAKSQPLLFGAVLLLSLKCSARVQSEGGQEGSFGPVFLRFLRFQKLQTWIYPNSTSVADTGQSGEKERKKKEKRRKLNTPNVGCLSEIGCVGRAFSLQIQAVLHHYVLNPGPGSSSVELIQALGEIQCARSKWKLLEFLGLLDRQPKCRVW